MLKAKTFKKCFVAEKPIRGYRKSSHPWLRKLQAADPWRERDGARRHPHVSVLFLHPKGPGALVQRAGPLFFFTLGVKRGVLCHAVSVPKVSRSRLSLSCS